VNPDDTARITYYWIDDDEAISSNQVRVTRDLSVAVPFALALTPLLYPVSNCALQRYTVGLRYLDLANPSPSPGSSVYRRSVFIFRTAAAELCILSLPGINDALTLQPPDPYAGVRYDLSNVAVAALIAGVLTGLGGSQPCAPWADDLVDIVDAYWGYERAGW
jgi:hypothetical protein